VVWKLDRLARSLRQLVETLEGLSERQVGFRSLTESLDADAAGGRLFFASSGPWRSLSGTLSANAHRIGVAPLPRILNAYLCSSAF